MVRVATRVFLLQQPVHRAVMKCHSKCLANILEKDPTAINAIMPHLKYNPIHMVAGFEDVLPNPVEILNQAIVYPNLSTVIIIQGIRDAIVVCNVVLKKVKNTQSQINITSSLG